MEEEKHGKICPNIRKMSSLRASRLLEIKVSVLQGKKKRHLKNLSFIKFRQEQSRSFLVRPPKLQETIQSQKFKGKENLLRPLSNRKASLQTSSRIRISFHGDNWKEKRLNQTQLKFSLKKKVAEELKKGRKRIMHFWDERLERFQKLRDVEKFRAQEETKAFEEVTQILKKREETLLGEVRNLKEEFEKKARTADHIDYLMSRNNVFKLSGNMALGSEAYPNDISDIKQSLKLLKAKQNQRKGDQYPDPSYPYNGGSSNGAYGGTNGQSNGTYSANLPQRNSRGNEKGYDPYEQAVKNNVPRRETYEDPYGKQYENYKQPSINQRGSQRRNEDFQYKVERPNERKNTKVDYQQDYEQKPTYSRQPQYEQQRRGEPEKKDQRRREPERREPERRRQPQRTRQPQRRREAGRGRQQEYVNSIEQKSIKEVNKQNRVDIVEYDPSELVECGQGCGRKFNPNSIDKHEAICKKVFQKKRKEFNTQEQRLVVKDQKKMMKQGEAIQRKMEEKKAKEKIPKWKAESLAFRAGLKAASGNGGGLTKEEQKMLDVAKKAETMQCQFCGRNFNHTAGARHVAFCEQQSKKNSLKR